MKYFINFLKFEVHKTFASFGCPKVACSRNGHVIFFVIHGENNVMHCLPRALISSISRDIRPQPMKHMKRRTLTIGT